MTVAAGGFGLCGILENQIALFCGNGNTSFAIVDNSAGVAWQADRLSASA